MSWTYCGKCDNGMDEPTLRQVLEGEYVCSICGHNNDPHMTLAEVVLTLLERVEALEVKDGIHT